MGRIVGPNGQPIATPEDIQRAQAAQAQQRFAVLAFQAVAVFLYEKKDRKRTIPKELLQAIASKNLNLEIREDAGNVYIALSDPEPIEAPEADDADEGGSDGAER